MTYAIEYFNVKTSKYYLGDDTFATEEDAINHFKSIQYSLSDNVVFNRIVDINAEEEKKEGPVKMSYKIKFYNTKTKKEYLDEVGHRTYNEALLVAEHIGHNFLDENVKILGIEKVEENPIDIIDEGKKELVYDLTDDGKGKKYDSGKSMVGTLCRVFPRALLGVGQCIKFGTRKYPKPDNWKLVDGAFTRYQDSMMRHYLKFLAGQEKDSETNLLHLKHMVWNALAILELYLMDHKDETLFD